MIKGEELKKLSEKTRDSNERYCKLAILLKKEINEPEYDSDSDFYEYLLKTLDKSIYLGNIFSQSYVDADDIYKRIEYISECIISRIPIETKYVIIPLGKIAKDMRMKYPINTTIVQLTIRMIESLLIKLKKSDRDICIIAVNDIVDSNRYDYITMSGSVLLPTETVPGLGSTLMYIAQEVYRLDFISETKTFSCQCVKSRINKFGDTCNIDIGRAKKQEEIE